MRPERPYTYLSTTTGMCRSCRKLTSSRIIERNGSVFQTNLCPDCGPQEAMIAESFSWYVGHMRTTVRSRPFNTPSHPVRKGCPHDCGPCTLHSGACNLPVFSITNACDLKCPICFTFNRPDKAWYMSREELSRLLDRLIERSGPFDLINITGGEPTLHPKLIDLINEARRPEIGRVTVNSNGMRIAREPEFCRSLAETGAYVILSFDTLSPETSVRIHGKDIVANKLQALENLQTAGVGTTLLHVLIPGVNENEFGAILDLADRFSCVRSITVQTMTYTGFGGRTFEPRTHLPLDRAARLVEEATGSRLQRSFFRPLPAAHPLCYQIAYIFRWNKKLYDFSRIFTTEELDLLLGQGYLLRPSDASEDVFRTALDRLWATGGGEDLLAGFRAIISELYPSSGRLPTVAERQRIGEKYVLTVYLHAHMDEDNFDVARVSTCPDQVPDPEGRLIPACAYNLFYRMHDKRFWTDGDAKTTDKSISVKEG
ncbi:MAG: radical SAM protein [Candidatus Riflebacteria bacterium]|nr:radical SAM protein [Candidatus Riflebacteria bacterium]